MDSEVSHSGIPCLVCNTLVRDSDNQSFSSSSSYSEDKKITIFLLRTLLEIPKPLAHLEDDEESMEDNGKCSRFLVTCDQCKETIKQARVIYSEIRGLSQRFREIQKKIVGALKICTATGDKAPEVLDVVKYYRKLVSDCDFNGFGFPLIVHDEEKVVSSTSNASSLHSEGIENDWDSSKFKPFDVNVKQEVNDEQQVGLIYPEGDKEEEHEKDSDYHFSQEDSETEDDDDNNDDENQVSQVVSGDDNETTTVSRRRGPGSRCCPPKSGQDPPKKPWHRPSNPFPCPLCHHSLKTINILRVHLKRSHPGNSVSIKDYRSRLQKPCGQEAKKMRRKNLKQCCNPDNPFSCHLCSHRFKNLRTFKQHLKFSHPKNNSMSLDNKLFPPTTVASTGSTKSNSKKSTHRKIPPDAAIVTDLSSFPKKYPHLICKENSEGKYPCPWTDPSSCPKIFVGKFELHRHITVRHLNLPMYTCTWSDGEEGSSQFCGKTFAYRSNYMEHYDKHRGIPKYKCEECQLTFFRRNYFTRHKQSVHLNEKYVCEICGRSYSCQDYLFQHKSTVHMGKWPKNKPQNKKVVQRNDHDDKTNENPPLGVICDLCGQILKNKLTLKSHVEAKHDKVPGKYCCHLCDKRFKVSTSLNVHLWKKHDHKVEGFEEKVSGKYPCHLCDKRFRASTHLNVHLWERHQLKVEGFQPKEKVARKDKLQCPVKGCRKLFLKKENLEKHRIEVHGEDGNKPGPWNCKHCGKNFFWKEKWEHCEKTHENMESRPEKCEVCGKGFPTQHHLKFHLKHTHKMQLEDNRGWRKGK